MTTIRRGLAALSLPFLLAGSLSACGGGGDAASAPDDASVSDFCGNLDDITEIEGDDPDAAHEAADKLKEVGTPSDFDDDAREGFEIFTDYFADADQDDLDAIEDSGDPGDVFDDGDDADKVNAFIEQTSTVCADELTN